MSKYMDVYLDLKNKIVNGEYRLGERLPSESHLMRIYGYSRVTVNAAMVRLRDRGFISRTVGDGSYVIYDGQSGLAGRQNVALLLPMLYPALVSSIRKTLETRNIDLSLYITENSAEKEAEALERIIQNGVDGLICYPTLYEKGMLLLNDLLFHQFPVVFIDRAPTTITCSCVMDDGYFNMFRTTERLISLGHTRIAYVSPGLAPALETLRSRFNGFSDALTKHRLSNDNNYIIPATGFYYDQKDFYQAFSKVLSNPQNPTVVLCASGNVSFSLMQFAKSHNYRIPEDFSIAGYDETEDPEISTNLQDFKAIGEEAADILLKKMFDRYHGNRKVYVPGIVHEGSTIRNLNSSRKQV